MRSLWTVSACVVAWCMCARVRTLVALCALLVGGWPGLRNVKGALYDRDYVLQLSHGAFPPDNLHVDDVMSRHIVSAQLDTSVKK